MTITYIYFIYGLCVMFYSMMAWFFLRKNREMLSRLVTVLMIVLSVQCVKDLFFITPEAGLDSRTWMIMTAMDMIAIPLYVFVLIELCRPGTLNMRMVILHELPFVLFPVLFAIICNEIYYYANVVWAAIYGFGYALWAVIEIPKYNRFLKERLSYDENINLNWLFYILLSFFVILSLWIVDCLIVNYDLEAGYMLASLIIWMFICYFIFRHESVVDEFNNPAIEDLGGSESGGLSTSYTLNKRICQLFETDKIYLNPHLKLSDVAAMVNSNRTYVSRFFNDNHNKTFFEFVNEYRVRYAMALLKTSDKKLDEIADLSGFSSRQSFHRVFSKIAGCTPEQYRKTN